MQDERSTRALSTAGGLVSRVNPMKVTLHDMFHDMFPLSSTLGLQKRFLVLAQYSSLVQLTGQKFKKTLKNPRSEFRIESEG